MGDDEGLAVLCTGAVAVADDDVGAVELPPPPAGRPAEEPPVVLGTGRPGTVSKVPIICGSPLLPRLLLPGSFDEEEVPRGAEAAELRKNPGCTKPSSSTTSNPAPPAAATRLVKTALPMPARAVSPSTLRLPRDRPPDRAPRWDRADSGIVRKSSMTCSFSSALARIGSSSGAQRTMQASRRSRQA